MAPDGLVRILSAFSGILQRSQRRICVNIILHSLVSHTKREARGFVRMDRKNSVATPSPPGFGGEGRERGRLFHTKREARGFVRMDRKNSVATPSPPGFGGEGRERGRLFHTKREARGFVWNPGTFPASARRNGLNPAHPDPCPSFAVPGRRESRRRPCASVF